MNTQDPIRSAALKSQHILHEGLGSLAEIRSMRTGLSNAVPVAPGVQARKDAQAFSEVVGAVFAPAKYDNFRARVQHIELTVEHLSSTKIGRPIEMMNSSLLTVRAEMTTIIVADEKTPDTRLATVVSCFANLERSGMAYAAHEHKERALAAANEIKQSGPGSLLRSTLAAPSPAPGKKSTMVFGLG